MNNHCREHLEETLKGSPPCCILITCRGPSENGEMQVRMTRHGDTTLISYLLQGAQSLIDAEESEEINGDEPGESSFLNN